MKSKFLLLLICGGLFLLTLISYSYYNYQKRSAAISSQVVFDGDKYERKQFSASSKINTFSLYTNTPSSPGFIAGTQGLGVKAFAGRNVDIENNGKVETLLPEETINQLFLQKKINEDQNPSFAAYSLIAQGSQHFYYGQNINGIPVYGANVNMHVNDNQVYAFDGSVTTDSTFPTANITEEQAQEIALNKAKQETNNQISLYIYQAEKTIINELILGISQDDSNHLTLNVWIRSEDNSINIFSKKYFVDLADGKIIYQEEKLIKVLDREIKKCKNQNDCQMLRKEGQDAVTDAEANQTYDILGKTYNFYFDSFNRDSFDGNGAKLVGVIHLEDQSCPNAFADPATNWIFLCDGMYAEDVITHELTHLVTGNRLVYNHQSGAMNESISDIFATGVDNDWTMGEDTTLGVIRYMDDPTKSTKYGPSQPDRLFSPNYNCKAQDNGGVHVNNGILNKTFYLMSEGGIFNGCTLQAIGKTKAHQIFYRALLTYATPTANYGNMYDYINRACNDLYGESSIDCFNVKSVMQATEMDQQPAGSQKSPKCSGEQPQTPACVNTQPPTSSPTNGPTTPVSPSQSLSPTSPLQPTVPPLPTVPITPTGNVEVDLKLKFQGVLTKPSDSINKLYVKLSLISNEGKKEESYGIFTADDKGIWSGKTFFNFNPLLETPKYKLLIKGPMHVQKKICDSAPTETEEGYYQCSIPNISIKKGINSFDFSKITLLAGDLSKQDGIVNSYDLSLVRQRLGQNAAGPQMYDLNLDGVINTQDYSLILFTLSIRFDD